MSTTARKYPKKNGEQGVNYSYTCKNEFCNPKNKFHSVADLEDEAIGVLRDIYGDGSRIKGAVLKHFDDEARKLRDPHQSIEDLTAHVSKLKAKRSKLLDLYLEDSFTKDELDERAQTLDNQIAEAERQLGKLRDNRKTLREIKGLRREIMEAVVDDQYRYHLSLEEYDYDGTPTDDWQVEGAPTRNRLYKDIGLKV
jgi:DNA repair exonuclease SbcCD ATPase subunit